MREKPASSLIDFGKNHFENVQISYDASGGLLKSSNTFYDG